MTEGPATSRSWRRKAGVGAVVLLSASIVGVPAGAAPTAPGAPTIISAGPAVQGVTITFNEPATDGGARIFDYRVRCTSTNGGVAVEQSVGKSPKHLGGLTVGKTYTCRVSARNEVGQGPASAPSPVFVPLPDPLRLVPPAPMVLSVKPGVESVTVVFTIPAQPYGALPVNMTRARCRSSDGGVTKRQKTRRLGRVTVEHLTAGKTYRCSAAARNDRGYGPFSAFSDPVVTLSAPVLPGAPFVTSVTAIAHGLTVAFTAPENDGHSRIFRYRAVCTATDSATAVDATGDQSPVSVVGLAGGHEYTCTVAARNVAGLGPPSAPSDPVAVVTHATLQNGQAAFRPSSSAFIAVNVASLNPPSV